MEKGFTSQLTIHVTKRPLGFFPTLRMLSKSTFIIIGKIMIQIRTVMGREIPLTVRPFSKVTRPDIKWPTAMPAAMHKRTQRVK
mgnify:CR=1 FL=1|jgi:hypothetical protein